MKKNLLIGLPIVGIIALQSYSSNGQTPAFQSLGPDLVTNATNYNVGIGTTGQPGYKLTIGGDIGFEQASANRHIHGNTSGAFAIYGRTDWTDGSGIKLSAKDINNPASGEIAFLSTVQPGPGSSNAFRFVDENWDNHMTIDGNSNLKIRGDYYFSPAGHARSIIGNTTASLGIYSNGANWTDGSAILLAAGNGLSQGEGLASFLSTAQGGNLAFRFTDRNWNHLFTINAIGDIEARGNMSFSYSPNARAIVGNTSHSLGIYSHGANWVDGSAILLGAGSSSAQGDGLASFFSTAAPGNLAFRFADKSWNHLMTIDADGQVSIGGAPTVNTNTYKLYVKTGILTEKIKVALTTDNVNWSDFVFADDYQLKPLAEVEEYVKENKHLPEIPSAEEVYKNGLDLAQMDAKLLQKIEELTLYVIQQQKEINELKSKLNKTN